METSTFDLDCPFPFPLVSNVNQNNICPDKIANFILSNVYIFSDPKGRKERPQHPQGKATDVSLALALWGWLKEELCMCELIIKNSNVSCKKFLN